MYIIVVGGGKVGFYLAKELVESDHEVLVIEKDGRKCEQIAEELGDIVLKGDGCEVSTLETAGMARADMVLAVTGDDEDNLVVCQVARHRFHVAQMMARINNPKNEVVFKKLGIQNTVSATAVIMSQIEQELPTHPFISLITLHSGLKLVEVRIPPQAIVAGKALKDILLPPDTMISLVIDPGGMPRIPSGDTILHGEDAVVVVTRSESELALRHALTASAVGLDT